MLIVIIVCTIGIAILLLITTTIIKPFVTIIIIFDQVSQSVLLFCQGIGLLTSISIVERTVTINISTTIITIITIITITITANIIITIIISSQYLQQSAP